MKYYKERYREYLKSATWANIRAGVVSERGERCERCSSKYRIEVHHNKYPKIWGEERPEDLERTLSSMSHVAPRPSGPRRED